MIRTIRPLRRRAKRLALSRSALPPLGGRRAGRATVGIVVRVAFALGALCLAIAPVVAAPILRGDIVAGRDILTLGDLVEGVAGPAAEAPVFRAPALGETGTIQAHRVVEAARQQGLEGVETGGRVQITVTRAARRVGAAEIEAAVKAGLELRHRLDARALSVVFEGGAPALVLPPAVKDALKVEDLAYDPRSRRVTGLVTAGSRQASLRIAGSVVEMVEVAVFTRSIGRGEAVEAGDVAVERRVKESVPADAQGPEGADLAGRIARRALAAGMVVRSGDLARPEIVARGDIVTVVYEVPGLALTLRGRANEAGAQGDTIAVTNPQSKRVLQARVVAPGKVSVSDALPGRVAAAQP